MELKINVMPDDAELISAESRCRLVVSLFKNTSEMQTLGYDIGSLHNSALSAKQASKLENKRRTRVSLLDEANARQLLALDSRYTPGFLGSLPLSEASKLEMKRRRRVSLLAEANARQLLALDSR